MSAQKGVNFWKMVERESHVTPLADEGADGRPPRNPRPKLTQVEDSACDTISPIPIVNECSDSGGSKLKKLPHKRRHRSRRLREPLQPFERVNYLMDGGPTFALHQAASNNMHLANIILKPQVSRLLNDNEQLNHRVSRISERNRTLSLERERLLTTIQNTAAILQSTVTSLGREREPRFQLEDVPKKPKSAESPGSDFLEQSTKCTIKEFDNLLTALQSNGHEKVESRATFDLGYGSAKSKSLSQYDIIVKWLNNETPQRSTSTNRSTTTTASNPTSSSSSSSTSTVCQEELDKLLESATISNEKCYTLITKEANDAEAVPETSEAVADDGPDEEPDDEPAQEPAFSQEPAFPQEPEEPTEQPESPEKVPDESMLWLGATAEPAAAASPARKPSSVEELKSGSSSDSQTNQDEHEEFISLCNTMIQRMDSMISRSSNTGHIKELMLDDAKKHLASPPETTTLITRPPRKPQTRRRRPHVDLRKLDRAISTSSTLSWPDIDQVEHEGDLKTVQKCLASLEIMNIRRTNQALTQTLIIKALRKLLARQFCNLSRAHRDDTSDSEQNFSATNATAMGSSVAERPEKTEGEQPKGAEMYRIIDNVSKSIIYNDMGYEFAQLRNHVYERPNCACGLNLRPPLAEMALRRRQRWPSKEVDCGHRKATICGREAALAKSCRTEVRAELNRLQAEEQKPIPRCWVYVGVLIVLSQLHLFRWFKNIVRLILKF